MISNSKSLGDTEVSKVKYFYKLFHYWRYHTQVWRYKYKVSGIELKGIIIFLDEKL